jgi:hypothetical protein
MGKLLDSRMNIDREQAVIPERKNESILSERRRYKSMKQVTIVGILVIILAVSVPAVAGEEGHGAMPGMFAAHHMKEHGSMHGGKEKTPAKEHGMMSMGHKIHEGKVGPWSAEIRLVDMKAQMAKSKVSEKMKAKMKHTHHLMVALTDPGTKKQVTEGKGSVTVTGPDKVKSRYDFMGMHGHFGSDITLNKPGKYAFEVAIEAGGKNGKSTFHHTIK